MVSGEKVRHNDTEATEVIPTDGVFFFIGHKPETGFANGVVETDDTGRILTDGSCACAMPEASSNGFDQQFALTSYKRLRQARDSSHAALPDRQ